MSNLPPQFIYLIAALLIPFVRGKLRSVVLLATPAIALTQLLLLGKGATCDVRLLEYSLELLRIDEYSYVFGILFNISAFIGMVFSLQVKDTIQPLSSLLYVGARLPRRM